MDTPRDVPQLRIPAGGLGSTHRETLLAWSAMRGGSEVTETVHRQQIRPVPLEGAEVMDRIFAGQAKDA